jgi:16S rRNA (cytosine1402-N4)-methyltransferase
VVEYLAVREAGVYVDATLGLGGTAERVLEAAPAVQVIGVDRDPESLELARERLARFGDRVQLIHGRFSELGQLIDKAGVERADGVIADLGVSYYQLTDSARGFSYQSECELDMRMDRSAGGLTAADLLNNAAEIELSELIYRLGEERRARRVARSIVRARPVRTSSQLAGAIASVVPRTWIHSVLQRVFMALRMAVNEELDELGALLEAAPGRVRPGGRMVVISFHSLEDRMVKQAWVKLAREARGSILTKKVVRPSEQERSRNPASRSAKLRAVEILS